MRSRRPQRGPKRAFFGPPGAQKESLLGPVLDRVEGEAPAAGLLDAPRDLLQDALHECGVSEFSPKIGESVRDAFGIADNYKKVVAETPGQELTIAEVIEPGFMIRTPEGSDDCIKPAKVAVYGSATGSEIDG